MEKDRFSELCGELSDGVHYDRCAGTKKDIMKKEGEGMNEEKLDPVELSDEQLDQAAGGVGEGGIRARLVCNDCHFIGYWVREDQLRDEDKYCLRCKSRNVWPYRYDTFLPPGDYYDIYTGKTTRGG